MFLFFSGSLGFRSIKRLPITGLYKFKITIRKRSLGPKWKHVQKGLEYPEKKKKLYPEDEENVAELKNILNKSWLELERMLFCTKLAICVMRYKNNCQMGNVQLRAEASPSKIQSITITLH